jgi:outer membrane protein TolC
MVFTVALPFLFFHGAQCSDSLVIKLDIDQAIAIAMQDNRSLKGYGYDLEGRKLDLSTAESDFAVKTYPLASAAIEDGSEILQTGLSFKKRFVNGMEATVSPMLGRTAGDYSANLATSLSIPLLRGAGKDINLDRINVSRFSIRSSERSLYQQKVNTVLNAVSGVYEIIRQQSLVGLYEDQVQRLKSHGENAAIKERVGLATPMDVYRAEIRRKDAEDNLTLAQEGFRDTQDRLKLLLSLPLDTVIEVSAPLKVDPVRLSFHEAADIALNNRIELKQRQDELAEVKRKSVLAKHNLQPQLDMVLQYRKSGLPDGITDSFGLNEDRWSVSLVSNTDISRTAEKNSYQQSLLNINMAQLNFENNREDIFREVKQQLKSMEQSLDRIRIRKEQIDQAEGRLALAKVQFRHGKTDNFDVIEAETEYQRAKANMLAVETDYIVGAFRMRAYLGTLIETPVEPSR